MLQGDLDRHTVGTLHQALADALQSHPSVIHIDLTAVTHVDAAGNGALLAAARVGDQAGYRFTMTLSGEFDDAGP
jgi:anti-anti-sigma regulatory factor